MNSARCTAAVPAGRAAMGANSFSRKQSCFFDRLFALCMLLIELRPLRIMHGGGLRATRQSFGSRD